MTKFHFWFPWKLYKEAEQLVKEGRYQNMSELVRDAVRKLIDKTE
jgi:Arc/MetJ-type ribon-helix-helix transcriptional regulator